MQHSIPTATQDQKGRVIPCLGMLLILTTGNDNTPTRNQLLRRSVHYNQTAFLTLEEYCQHSQHQQHITPIITNSTVTPQSPVA
jgi:hypothetical protein